MPHLYDPCAVNSISASSSASPVEGRVVWDPVHSLWNSAMAITALGVAPFFANWGALAVFVATTGVALLFGHSIGFHRLMIHRSFACPRWLEYVLIWFGTAVGMSGPLWMVRTHDMRDWAQRQPHSHDYLAHRQPMLIDAWWQLHCRLILESPPQFDLGQIGRDPMYRFLERTWMLQQVLIAGPLYAVGGWSWVLWGVSVRVFVSVTGHWYVGHLAHRRGPQSWLVEGAGVQAHDVPWAAILTMGEAWHNNHHAYPGSARIGLAPGQSDWGYAVIQLLERVGLARDVRTASTMTARARDLIPSAPESSVPHAANGGCG